MVERKAFGTIQAKKGQQASRLRPLPQRLGSLLDHINMLPPGLTLMSFNDALLMAESQSSETIGIDKAKLALNFCLSGLSDEERPPECFRDYVLGLPDSMYLDPMSALYEAVKRYVSFRTARLKLCGMARLNRLRPGRISEFEAFLDSLGAGTRTEIDQEGRIRFVKDWFGEVAEGEEAARIRECAVCERVFWAGRIDQSCCNPRCADILRKRNKRKRDAAKKLEDKARRVENETYKEKVAAIRALRESATTSTRT